MSGVRMCDFAVGPGKICGTIFSEREVNWSTGHITVLDDEGKPHTEAADFCPDHTPRQRRQTTMPRFHAMEQTPELPSSPTSTTRVISPPDPETDNPWSDESSGGASETSTRESSSV